MREITLADMLGDVTLIRPQFLLGWYLNYLFLWYVIFWLVNLLRISEAGKLKVFLVILIILAFYFNFSSSLRFEQSFSFVTGMLIGKKKDLKKYISVENGMLSLVVSVLVLAAKQVSFIRQQSQTI